MIEKKKLVLLDTGLANTGVLVATVSVRSATIESVETWKTTPKVSSHRTDFADGVQRARLQADRLASLLADVKPDEIVAESYRDISGRLRKAANRWTTPLVLGYFIAVSDGLGYPLVFQDPEVVMTRYAGHVRAWKANIRGVVGGDSALTNEHLRSAGAHLLFYLDSHK